MSGLGKLIKFGVKAAKEWDADKAASKVLRDRKKSNQQIIEKMKKKPAPAPSSTRYRYYDEDLDAIIKAKGELKKAVDPSTLSDLDIRNKIAKEVTFYTDPSKISNSRVQSEKEGMKILHDYWKKRLDERIQYFKKNTGQDPFDVLKQQESVVVPLKKD